MNYTISPNMFLRIPSVGNDAGPDYADNINYDLLSIIDVHDHTPGRGPQITPAGLNINTSLTLNGNFATDIAGLTMAAQSSTPAINTIYQSGYDLYFVDGVGNNVRITQSGGVAGTPGSITNLVAPASVNYVSGSQTYVFQSNTAIAGNLDAGALLLRNLTPDSTFSVTLQPQAALASNYTLTLPSVPGVKNIMMLDNTGAMSAALNVDNSSIEIATNTIQVKAGGIQQAMLGTLTAPTVQRFTSGSGTYTTPAGVRWIRVRMVGAGGGGAGAGAAGYAGSAGGATGGASTFGTSLITAGGGVGAGGISTQNGGSGGTFTINSPAIDMGSSFGGQGDGAAVSPTGSGFVTIKGGHGGGSYFGSGGSSGYGVNGIVGGPRGSGGGGGSSNGAFTIFSGVGGGAGAYADALIAAPGASYSYSVGASGAGGVTGDPNGTNGGAGADGIIIVEEYYI